MDTHKHMHTHSHKQAHPKNVSLMGKVWSVSPHLSPLIKTAAWRLTLFVFPRAAVQCVYVCVCVLGLGPPRPNDVAVKSGRSPAPSLITPLQIHLLRRLCLFMHAPHATVPVWLYLYLLLVYI